MSFLASINKHIQPPTPDAIPDNIPDTAPDNNLNKEEIELMLSIIRTSTFRGGDVELLYNTITKLQAQFIKLQTQ